MDQELDRAEASAGNATTNGSEARTRIQRVHSEKILPSERYSFEAHIPVLRNLVGRSSMGRKHVPTQVIEEDLPTQSASLNVRFLYDIGLATRDNRMYAATGEAVQFVKLLGIDEGRARAFLADHLQGQWFTDVVVDHLRLVGSATPSQLITELALAAMVSNKKAKQRAFEVLLDYLAWSGIVVRDADGEFRLPAAHEEAEESLNAAHEAPKTSNMAAPTAAPPAPEAGAAAATHVVNPPTTSDWISRNWPGVYNLQMKPSTRAVRMVRSVLEEVEAALELQDTQGNEHVGPRD